MTLLKTTFDGRIVHESGLLSLDRLHEMRICGRINDRAISWAKADMLRASDDLVAHFASVVTVGWI